MNRHHDQGNSYKEVQSIITRQEPGSIQAGMVQEELRVLHLHLEATSRILSYRQLG